MISRLIHLCRSADPDITAEEVADVLWLSAFLAPPAVAAPDAEGSRDGLEPRAAGGGRLDEPVEPEFPAEWDLPDAPPDDTTRHDGHAHMALPPPRGLMLTSHAVPSRSPAVLAIPDALSMSRALRPLRRKVDSRRDSRPDEERTARLVAETGLWIPRTRPTRERWLSLDLVVDDSASMVVWSRTVAELCSVLQHLGAFRHIRIWRVDGDLEPGRRVTLRRGESLAKHSPGELVDPAGRRMVLVVSDCVGQAWGNGALADVLELWGSSGPVAIAQVLPQRLWADCHPQFVPVRLRASAPGEPNARHAVESRALDVPLHDAGLPVPVCELDARWLKSLAQLVSGSGTWINSSVVFTGLLRDAQVVDDHVEPDPPELIQPGELVRQFHSGASNDAYKLATCLAGAPLSLPVMRLVQSAMLPKSRPAHLAEVFLSGLLTLDRENSHAVPDEVAYDFRPGVRQVLLDELSSADALQVLDKVSDYVTKRLGSPRDFLAVLTSGQPIEGISERARPFATIAFEVLNRVGGRYREAAEQLRNQVLEPSSAPDVGLQSFAVKRYESAVTTSDVLGRPRLSPVHQPAIMGGVPLRNPNFTGREVLLEQLRNRLETSSAKTALLPHTLHGLGGVGKTQLAVEYVHRYSSEYDLVWWVSAEESAQIRASLVELGARMGLPAIGDSKRAVAAVLDALRTGKPHLHWLLVFDNCDSPESTRQFLPHPTGHVLITSRDRTWTGYADVLEVNVLDREDSIRLLQRRRPDISSDDADALAEWLGDLPLALEQAAAWQAETGMPVREYLRLLESRFDLLAERPRGSYPTSVAATWEVGFETLAAESEVAAQLLELCAFFGPVPIGMGLLKDGSAAERLPSPLRETLSDDISLRRAVREIGRYALAKVNAQHDQIEVHRLVQTVVRGRLDVKVHGTVRDRVQQILAAANPGVPDDASTWPRHRELTSHILPAAVIYAKDESVRRVALDQIRYLYAIGDHIGSEALAKLSVVAWRAGFGSDDELTLIATRHWANALRALGDVQQAEVLDRDTFERFKARFGLDHDHTLATANSVGADLRALGRFVDAKALDEDNLRRHRAKWGNDHPLTLRTANNLAVDLRLLGDAQGALELDRSIVDCHEKRLGRDDRMTLFAICNMVRDLLGLGRYAEALRQQESVFPRYERIFDSNHPDILLARRNLVIALRKSGRYTEAERLGEQNFTASKAKLGGGHEHTLTAMMSYANALRCTGDIGKALALAREAFDRYRSNYFGPDHPFTLACAINVAIILRNAGERAEARELNERTVGRLRAGLGAEHPAVLCCMTSLSNDFAVAGDNDRAHALALETLELSRRVRGADHPYTHACEVNAGLLEEGCAGLVRHLGADHAEVIEAKAGARMDCDIEPSPS